MTTHGKTQLFSPSLLQGKGTGASDSISLAWRACDWSGELAAGVAIGAQESARIGIPGATGRWQMLAQQRFRASLVALDSLGTDFEVVPEQQVDRIGGDVVGRLSSGLGEPNG